MTMRAAIHAIAGGILADSPNICLAIHSNAR